MHSPARGPHLSRPGRGGWGRGLARPAQCDSPPSCSCACAVYTDHPRAPQREVRGSRRVAAGASDSDSALWAGPTGEGPCGEVGHQIGSASAVGTPPGSKKWRFRFGKPYLFQAGIGRRPTGRAGWPPGVAGRKSSRCLLARDALWARGRRGPRSLGPETGPRIRSLVGGRLLCVAWARGG